MKPATANASRPAPDGRRTSRLAWPVALSLLLVACADIGSRPEAAVTGSVALATDTVLPADARLRVTLLGEDATGALDPVAEVEMLAPRLPTTFELRYDPRAIDTARRYLLQAALTGNGLLMMLTAEQYPVVTLGNPPTADLLLHPAGN